jgi:membrane-associated phospholipid phosphatase
MIDFFRKTQGFFWLYGLFLLAGFWLQTRFSSEEIFLFVNNHNYKTSDSFFRYFTNLGDGIFYAVVSICLLLFVSYRDGLLSALCFAVSSLVAQGLKIFVFADRLRPKAFFENLHRKIYLIDGLEVYSMNSFPSGHTATAFSVFLLLAVLVGSRRLSWVFFIPAFLVAYSRMYLSQHFFADVYFGSLIGVGTTVGLYAIFQQLSPRIWHKRALLRRN